MPKFTEDKAVIGFLAIIAIWTLVALPLLYYPSPSGPKASNPQQSHSEQSKQNIAGDPRGTEAEPFFIKALPTQKTAEEAAQEAQDRHEKATTDWWLMAFTGALFFATVGLIGATGVLGYFAYRQMRDMKESLAITRKAADAADLSARAAIGLELPIIGVDAPDMNGMFEPLRENESYACVNIDGLPMRYSVISWMHLHNAGRTPAFPNEFAIGWTISQERPSNPVFARVYPCDSGDIIEPGKVFDMELNFQIELSESNIAILKKGDVFLWLFVQLTYRDFLNLPREGGYFWRWNNPGGGMFFFERSGAPSVQYAPNN